MKGLGALLVVIFGFLMWFCGIGVFVSIGAAVLKLCGVSLVASMSYWVPLQFAGGYLLSLFMVALGIGMTQS